MWNKRFLYWLIPCLVLLLLIGAGLYGLFAYFLPYRNAANTMDPAGQLTLYAQPDGSTSVHWPAGDNVDSYTLQVLTPQGQTLYSTTTTQTTCTLPQLTAETVLLRISSCHVYRDEIRPGEECLEATVDLSAPEVQALDYRIDPDTDQLHITYKLSPGEQCRVWHQRTGEDAQLLQETAELALSVAYAHALPQHGVQETYRFEVIRQTGNATYYGIPTGSFTLCREDFLDTTLELQCAERENNTYCLTWNETKGDHYEVHMQTAEGDWQLLATIPKDSERSFTTDHLLPFTDYTFRVSAIGTEEVTPDSVSVCTKERSLYSTIWPIIDLEVKNGDRILGTAKAGSAYCVIEETAGLFGIRFGEQTGYIDSNYCMINLPEYMGALCAYDITNSYSSIYLVHDFPIDQVSDTVICGYEQVRLSEQEYLVPLLYPTAKKLIPAAQNALSQGYQIKIYDAFRPREATLSIYDLTERIIDSPVPKNTFTGEPVKELEALSFQGVQDPLSESLMEGLTYRILMTDNNRYSLANFLAKGISNHNLGVAMDMTLQTLAGEELAMQTAIHDLSWYSEPDRNNENADLLKKIMTGAGFGMIKAEWWHFQDDAIKQQLDIRNLHQGVSPACWMKDDTGWRYRQSNGQYLTGCSAVLDGITYTFDANGYVQ